MYYADLNLFNYKKQLESLMVRSFASSKVFFFFTVERNPYYAFLAGFIFLLLGLMVCENCLQSFESLNILFFDTVY